MTDENLKILLDMKLEMLGDKAILVTLSDDILNKIDVFTDNLIKVKLTEKSHQFDNLNEKKRWTTGLMGEAALEELLGLQFIDWSIGRSLNYNYPDIIGLNLGVKSVEYPNFPVIFKDNTYPQIICIKMSNRDVLVCGVATVDVLNMCQADSFIKDRNIRNKGTKTCFAGIEHLISISDFLSTMK